ncbi:MAG: hypothetical protein IPG74_15085 [Flavobacteriales bacterium]|nr:hypothetical protein [Flavobacteriales bacterium]
MKPRTVDSHIYNICKLLGLKSRMGLGAVGRACRVGEIVRLHARQVHWRSRKTH